MQPRPHLRSIQPSQQAIQPLLPRQRLPAIHLLRRIHPFNNEYQKATSPSEYLLRSSHVLNKLLIYCCAVIAIPVHAFTGEPTVVPANPNAACIAAGIRAQALLSDLRIAAILVPAILITIMAMSYIFVKIGPRLFKILFLFFASLAGCCVISLPNLLLNLDHSRNEWIIAPWRVARYYHELNILALIFACIIVLFGGYLLKQYLETITASRVSIVIPVLIVGISILPWLYFTPYYRASVGLDPLVHSIGGCA